MLKFAMAVDRYYLLEALCQRVNVDVMDDVDVEAFFLGSSERIA